VYALEVHFPNEAVPRRVEVNRSAAGAMARIPELLREHDGCEKVVVYVGMTRLFSVDCKGNTTRD
jgi:hypothetical protein